MPETATHLTTEAKLRILFRIVKAASEVVPCVKEIKVFAEAAVDIADEVRKGTVVGSVATPELCRVQPIDPTPDLSLALLCQELKFDHISFPPDVFRTLLADSGTIQLEDCLIVPSGKNLIIHLDTLPGLQGRRQFGEAKLFVGSTGAVLTTPGSQIFNESDAPAKSCELVYTSGHSLTLGSRWTIHWSPEDRLSPNICSRLSVENLVCTVLGFYLQPEDADRNERPSREFSLCIVRS
jgi:hypothetical protein